MAIAVQPAKEVATKNKRSTKQRRVVVTGMGVVSPLGNDVDIFYNNLLEGVSGISEIEAFDCAQFPTRIAGEIKAFSTDGLVAPKLSKRMDKFMLYMLTAGKKALANGGVTEEVMNELDRAKCGVLIGSAMGGMKVFSDAIEALRISYRKMNPFCVPFATTNMGSAMLAMDLGWMGPNYSISTACATGNFCILSAANHIIRGEADVMLCGGSDAAIIPIGLGGFVACRALSQRNDDPTKASRPWDMNRDGFVMGEGAGVLLLEELEHAKARGANIYAEFLGGSFSCDAYHMTEPRPDGNTLNCNHPVVMELILDSLRHWVTEYHVDGFRFDLASVLCRGTDGSPLNSPPLIRAIAKDSVLSRCKIIAEPWDCGGLYLVGKFPNWDRWAEWNGKYRDDMRRFIRGDSGMKGSFAARVSGSADLYQVNKRKPYHSVNFVVAHDGFTLYDLVSYNFKHNEANGEGGNDGSNDNLSSNCGFEGETDDCNIKALRSKQMKNFHLALMISQERFQCLYIVPVVLLQLGNCGINWGTPMMLMGDEYGHTRHGNNNSYGHDTPINNFQWEILDAERSSQIRFFSEVIKFRQTHRVFRHDNFLTRDDVTWHEDNWDNNESRFLAFRLELMACIWHSLGPKGCTFTNDFGFSEDLNGFMIMMGEIIFLAFNAHDYFVEVSIPLPPPNGRWLRVVDTNLESPDDIFPEGDPGIGITYNVAPFSSILLEAKRV